MAFTSPPLINQATTRAVAEGVGGSTCEENGGRRESLYGVCTAENRVSVSTVRVCLCVQLRRAPLVSSELLSTRLLRLQTAQLPAPFNVIPTVPINRAPKNSFFGVTDILTFVSPVRPPEAPLSEAHHSSSPATRSRAPLSSPRAVPLPGACKIEAGKRENCIDILWTDLRSPHTHLSFSPTSPSQRGIPRAPLLCSTPTSSRNTA